MIMEYAEGGELFDYIIKKDHLSEDEARHIYHQIIDAIDYMHQMGICHRDLKPENILFDSTHTNIKIIDFGLSNLYYTNLNPFNDAQSSYEECDRDLLETPCGSPGYAPPEMVLGFSYNGLLTDIWSSGIILYAMLCGSFPFDDDSEQVLYSKIIKGFFEFPSEIYLTKEAKNLIKKILVVNPNRRANIEEIKNDPWFNKGYIPIYGLFLPIQEIPIDDAIIFEMEKYGYKKEEIIKNVKNNRHNEITTFYYLLVKKFSRNGIDIVNDLVSPSFTKYILAQNEKIKEYKNCRILINLKLIFEKLKLEENIKGEKGLSKEKGKEKDKDKDKKSKNEKKEIKLENEKEKEKAKENEEGNIKIIHEMRKQYKMEEKKRNKNNEEIEILSYDNKNCHKKNKDMLKEDININKHLSNISQRNENDSKNLSNTNRNKIKENQIKNVKNIILRKDKKFKKMKISDKKEAFKNYLKKKKINNNNNLEKNIRSQKKSELATSINQKQTGFFNISFPYQESEISGTLASSLQKEKYNFQGVNSSRLYTDRSNLDKYKQNIKTIAKKVNLPLYQKFKLNCKENIKNLNNKRKNKTNYHYINKVVKNSKALSFNVYTMNKNIKLKNIDNTNNSIKNILSKKEFLKNISIKKEKGDMSYRQLYKEKKLFENNLSRILNSSEGKLNSNSIGKNKIQANNQYSTRNKNNNNNSKSNKSNKSNKSYQKQKNNGDILEKKFYFKKIKKYRIENKDRTVQDLRFNSNKSNDNKNNINFSININLNLNQIKNQREKTTTEQNKYKKTIKSFKGIKLDLKHIGNNSQTYNGSYWTNSEKNNFDNVFKRKQDKNNYNVKTTKNIMNKISFNYNKQIKNESHSKDENINKKIDDSYFKNQEKNQKSFQIKNQKYNNFTNSLSKIIPLLKSMNSMKTKSLKKGNTNNFNPFNRKTITLSNNSNSIVINRTNLNLNQNKSTIRQNPKIEKIKQKQKLLNLKHLKNISDNSYSKEIPLSKSNLIEKAKLNMKKSPINMKMNPLNLKVFINGQKNLNIYKSLTMRGDQNNNNILFNMKQESSKNKNKANKTNKNNNIFNKDEKCVIKGITKISPNKNNINNDAIYDISPFKMKDILFKIFPKNNITIIQKSIKGNYFTFHCIKGEIQFIIELLQIKGNNNILLQMKFTSGNQKEFISIRNQILGIINSYLKENM